MADICFIYDTLFCLGGIYQEREGDGNDPSVMKKIFCPMTSVVDAIGYDKWKDILLAFSMGCWYTAFCFRVEPKFALPPSNNELPSPFRLKQQYISVGNEK